MMGNGFLTFSNRMAVLPWAVLGIAVSPPANANHLAHGQTVALGQPAEPTNAEIVADALSGAARASLGGDSKALSAQISLITAMGARPAADAAKADPLPLWRTAVRLDSAPPMRGSLLGPGYRAGQLDPGSQDKFEQLFLSGRKASIALSSPANVPLALVVLDSNRKPVCEVKDARLACHWMPLFTQRYTIEVRNRGAQAADYFLVVE